MIGWWNTVELVLFEISNSIKPYPSVFHAYTNKMRPVIVSLSQQISTSFPTVFRQPLDEGRLAAPDGAVGADEEADEGGAVAPGVAAAARGSLAPRWCAAR